MAVIHLYLASPLFAFYIELRSGLKMSIKYFSLSFLAKVLSQFIFYNKFIVIVRRGEADNEKAMCKSVYFEQITASGGNRIRDCLACRRAFNSVSCRVSNMRSS